MSDKNVIESYKKSADTAQKSIKSTVCNSYSWDLPLEPPHTGNSLPLKAVPGKSSSEISSLSPCNCEGYNFLPSASLDGSEDSATNGNVSSSEDDKKLEPANTLLILSVISDDACSLICTDPSQPVLRRKLKIQPALLKALQPGLKEAPLYSSLGLGNIPLLPSEEPNFMKDLDTEHAQLPVTEKHLQTLKTPVSILCVCMYIYMNLVF